MTDPRADQTGTLLPNGQVLIAAGQDANGSALDSAELYDPVTRSWALTAGVGGARLFHTATLLPTSHVLVAGGISGGNPPPGVLSSAELYDPGRGS